VDTSGPDQRRRPRVAILVVNGFDRRGRWGRYNEAEVLQYPWIELCLNRIERHSRTWDYDVLVFDNTHLAWHRELMEQHHRVRVRPSRRVATLGRLAGRVPGWPASRLFERPHPEALDYLARAVSSSYDYIVTLDTDSFPVDDRWLDVLVGACEDGAALAGVYRTEMAPAIRPFVHVSGLCVRRRDLRALKLSFRRGAGQDVGQNITDAFNRLGRQVFPLMRSNAVNFHFLMGGIYGDVLYHHGAGSRRAQFWTSTDVNADEQVSHTLRQAVFDDLDHLVAVLRGQVGGDFGLRAR
jgi:hypothetical protein